MKKVTLTLILFALILSSCASHHGITSNNNLNSTEVVLTKSNFKIVEIVKGEAEATYVFGFGGMKRDGLIAEAKAKMLQNSKMNGNSRAIVNETVEFKKSGFLFVNKYKVIVSGQIIEFIE